MLTTELISSAATIIARNGTYPMPGTGLGVLNAGLGKSRSKVVSIQNTVYSCIIFHITAFQL